MLYKSKCLDVYLVASATHLHNSLASSAPQSRPVNRDISKPN